jgi:hypothetical protein
MKKQPNEIGRMIAGHNNDLFVMIFIPGTFEFYRAGKLISVGSMLDDFRNTFIEQDGFKFAKLWLKFKAALEILQKARTIIGCEKFYTPNHLAEDINSNPVRINDPNAYKFCLVGAIEKAATNKYGLDSSIKDVYTILVDVFTNDLNKIVGKNKTGLHNGSYLVHVSQNVNYNQIIKKLDKFIVH